MQTYFTVSQSGNSEYEEKHSRFLGCAFHCVSDEQAAETLSELRSKYWDARHNVYAYILRDGTVRFSDDGEPHGTGGKPILEVLKGSGLCDVMITVTRYFGGVLLGTGGLVRAYQTAARDALDNAWKVEMCPCVYFSVLCEYSDHAKLTSLIERKGGIIEDTVFTDKVKMYFSFRSESAEEFEKALCEMFSSRLSAFREKEDYCAFPCCEK